MKKFLKNKKLLFNCVFVVLVFSIIVINVTVFPQFLKTTTNASAVEKITDKEIDMKDSNDVLGTIISEKKAIQIAKMGVSEEISKEKPSGIGAGPVITDFNTAQSTARYIYERASFPADDPFWVVIIVGQKEDFTAPMPEGISIKDISSIALEKGLVWENENGKLMAYYEKIIELTYVEVNAVTGDYSGYKCLTSVNDLGLKDNIKWLNEKYNTDFDLSEMDL